MTKVLKLVLALAVVGVGGRAWADEDDGPPGGGGPVQQPGQLTDVIIGISLAQDGPVGSGKLKAEAWGTLAGPSNGQASTLHLQIFHSSNPNLPLGAAHVFVCTTAGGSQFGPPASRVLEPGIPGGSYFATAWIERGGVTVQTKSTGPVLAP